MPNAPLHSTSATRCARPTGQRDHSWFIGNQVFSLDLLGTLKVDLDHRILPTREQVSGARRLHLVPGSS